MLIEVNNVVKSYSTGDIKTNVLDGLSVSVGKGEICAVLGPSGSGKSTLLNVIGGLDTVDSGTITIDGKNIVGMSSKELVRFRKENYGYVFQFYNLVGNLTALENVELASQICSDPLDAGQVLADVVLADRASNFPAQLSGGEQQRVAIARALAKNPKLLLCDEPTGALDYNTGKAVLKLLQDTCRKKGVTVVVITHNQAITAMADRIITVKNGTVTDMRKNEHIVPVEQIEW